MHISELGPLVCFLKPKLHSDILKEETRRGGRLQEITYVTIARSGTRSADMDPIAGSDVVEGKRIVPVKKGAGEPEAPPSSYGSMRSDEEEEDEDTTQCEIPRTTYGETLLRLNRSESPETVYTEVTQSTRRGEQGAYITDGKLEGGDKRDLAEEEEEEEGEEEREGFQDSPTQADSPEPVLLEAESGSERSEEEELGQLHRELEMSFIFKNIQNTLLSLSGWELYHYKRNLCGHDHRFTLDDLEECDSLDLVDKILEAYGKGEGLKTAIIVFEYLKKPGLARALEKNCKRALVQHDLRCHLIRKYEFIHEGIARPGEQRSLKSIYVEPQTSTRGRGVTQPFHPLRPHPHPAPRPASPDSFVGGNAVFCAPPAPPAATGSAPPAVRTVLTTGVAGIGCSIAVSKFIMDWSKDRANRDIQLIFLMPMEELWEHRQQQRGSGERLSFLELVRYYYAETNSAGFLEQADCRALYVLEGVDMYKTQLDFQGTRVVTDVCESATLDELLVNLIRGALMPHSLVWITGRRAATTHIPAELLHRVYEIQGFSDAMKDEFFTKRYKDKDLARRMLAHLKALPTLYHLCHMPFMCWVVATVFENCFRKNEQYGRCPPKLTPFYIHFLIVQTNRKMERYYGVNYDYQHWKDHDRELLMRIGKMALRLLEKNRSVFHEEDLKEQGLSWEEVVVYSSVCTELPAQDHSPPDRRSFCFIHYTFLEFMAALYVFQSFIVEGKLVLDPSVRMPRLFKEQRCLSDLLRVAADRALAAPYGQWDLLLRFLCGLALRLNNNGGILRGLIFPYDCPAAKGLEDAAQLLQRRRESAPPERHGNLDECVRELTQKDD